MFSEWYGYGFLLIFSEFKRILLGVKECYWDLVSSNECFAFWWVLFSVLEYYLVSVSVCEC